MLSYSGFSPYAGRPDPHNRNAISSRPIKNHSARPKRIIFNFAKEVGSPSAVDRTDYGTASGSARGFVQHHSQQLSRAAVCGDAQNINNAARNMRVAHSFMTGLNAPPPCARAF